MVINNPYEVESGLHFSFETVLTFHKKDQKGSATVMAHNNSDLVQLFFDKLEGKLKNAIQSEPTKCNGEPMKIEPKEPEK